MIIYIAGKINGDPNYQQKFENVAKQLTEQGHVVLNPALLPKGLEYEQYMSIGFAMIKECDAIYLLSD